MIDIRVAVLAILLLVTAVYVVGQVEQTALDNDAFQVDVGVETSEAVTSVPATLTLSNVPVVSGTVTLTAYNATDGNDYNGTLVENTNYTVLNYETGTFNITDLGGEEGADTRINTSYTYQGGDGYTALDTTLNNSYEGFELGSILPLVLFATMIIGVVIKLVG